MKRFLLLPLLAVIASALGCRGATSAEPPILPLRNMFDQDRYDPQASSGFYGDGRTMRAPQYGTISREAIIHPEVGQGRLTDDSGYALQIPGEVVDQAQGLQKLTERGHERYNIYCRPCHDGTGAGKGVVIVRGKFAPAPPTFHQERIRQMPDGQLFATISNGVRMMPAYAAQIPVQDRWAIVSYVRALQLSQGE